MRRFARLLPLASIALHAALNAGCVLDLPALREADAAVVPMDASDRTDGGADGGPMSGCPSGSVQCGDECVPDDPGCVPFDFGGRYLLTVVAGDNGCMFPNWNVGETSLSNLDVDQTGEEASLDANLAISTLFLFGLISAENMPATIVGDAMTTSELVGSLPFMVESGCRPLIRARIHLEATGAATALGEISLGYFGGSGMNCPDYVETCSTVLSLAGSRM